MAKSTNRSLKNTVFSKLSVIGINSDLQEVRYEMFWYNSSLLMKNDVTNHLSISVSQRTSDAGY